MAGVAENNQSASVVDMGIGGISLLSVIGAWKIDAGVEFSPLHPVSMRAKLIRDNLVADQKRPGTRSRGGMNFMSIPSFGDGHGCLIAVIVKTGAPQALIVEVQLIGWFVNESCPVLLSGIMAIRVVISDACDVACAVTAFVPHRVCTRYTGALKTKKAHGCEQPWALDLGSFGRSVDQTRDQQSVYR